MSTRLARPFGALLVAVLLALTMAIGACSGSDHSSDAGSPSPSPALPSASSTESATPASVVTPRPTGTAVASDANTIEGLDAFAQSVDAALAGGDLAVLVGRLREPDVRFYQWGQPVAAMPVRASADELT